MKLSIIIPTIDEYEDIKKVVELIYTSCDHEDIAEIKLVHSNSSTADYVAYLNTFRLLFPDVRIEVMKQSRPGVCAAICEGFYSASGDHVTAIGADLENDPRDIAVMIEMAKQHPDAVITASRKLRKGDFSDYPTLKRYCNTAFQTALHILFKTKQSDITYMFQCTPKELLYRYDFSGSEDTFILALALLPELHRDISVYEFPSRVSSRQHGESHLKTKYYLKLLKEMFRAISKQNDRKR